MVLGSARTMATATTASSRRVRAILVTFLLALGARRAQLGVILGMIRSLSFMATVVWAGTVLMTMFAVGWIAARLVPGQSSDFILELPPIRRPQLGNLVVKTMARIEWYLREAVPLFLLGTLVLFLADGCSSRRIALLRNRSSTASSCSRPAATRSDRSAARYGAAVCTPFRRVSRSRALWCRL